VKILTKIYQKMMRICSNVIAPKSRRRIIHAHFADYEMVVFANEDVGREIWLFGRYEVDETYYFKNHIRQTDICFDVGGNLGYFSLLMARLAVHGSVHVFEPIPINAALIKVNAELNGIQNMYVNNLAIGDHRGSVEFSVSVDSAYSSMHATGRSTEQQSISVPMVTLDDYLSSASLNRVDVMKVDVEGAEALVVQGASFLGEPSRRPRIVLMELFNENLSAFDSSVSSVIASMSLYGYIPHVLKDHGRRLDLYDATSHSKFYNIVFLLDSI
jgi:FkbM family methyltransferase